MPRIGGPQSGQRGPESRGRTPEGHGAERNPWLARLGSVLMIAVDADHSATECPHIGSNHDTRDG
jgi:hypothetical protein